ncbi:LytR/AlgR family response regulator transcription factor [Sphingobacterium thalpophilum]|uniref:Two-component response regulator n=1 Tax=Sphingobacterium thalpophilum TaxID=259 RepID=A0A4U9U4M2_9SPHI|nr:LytTR family DNA-binding domain-containing protein [Sphingobacterium thalpophilum]VTR27816.1 two-component response regulator [Sphingobacterium thalpophilum]
MNKLSYKLLIVDDQPDTLVYIMMSLRELPFIDEEIKVIQNPVDALEYLKENEVDILMLDMEFSGADIDGIKLAGLIPNPPVIVACSAYADYVFSANEAGIYSYFSKKISFNTLKAKMQDVVEMVDRKYEQQSRDVKSLLIKNLQNVMITIEVDQIFYAEVEGDIVDIFLEREVHQFKGNLRALQAELPANRFSRPRKNTLVNLAKVDLVRPNEVYLMKPRNDFCIVMTRSCKENFRHQYEVFKQNNL